MDLADVVLVAAVLALASAGLVASVRGQDRARAGVRTSKGRQPDAASARLADLGGPRPVRVFDQDAPWRLSSRP